MVSWYRPRLASARTSRRDNGAIGAVVDCSSRLSAAARIGIQIRTFLDLAAQVAPLVRRQTPARAVFTRRILLDVGIATGLLTYFECSRVALRLHLVALARLNVVTATVAVLVLGQGTCTGCGQGAGENTEAHKPGEPAASGAGCCWIVVERVVLGVPLP